MSDNSYIVEPTGKDLATSDYERHNASISIIDIKRFNLSDSKILDIPKVIPRTVVSENQIQTNVDYDDLCGPWSYPRNPLYNYYSNPPSLGLCQWTFITPEHVIYLKEHQRDKCKIISFFESQLRSIKLKENGRKILIALLWEVFTFTRVNFITDSGISTALGIMYLVHSFFLSHPWYSAQEVYQFMRETIMTHTVMNPPKSLEALTVDESKLLFEMFHEIYMENLVLLRIVCHANYRFTMNLRNVTS